MDGWRFARWALENNRGDAEELQFVIETLEATRRLKLPKDEPITKPLHVGDADLGPLLENPPDDALHSDPAFRAYLRFFNEVMKPSTTRVGLKYEAQDFLLGARGGRATYESNSRRCEVDVPEALRGQAPRRLAEFNARLLELLDPYLL